MALASTPLASHANAAFTGTFVTHRTSCTALSFDGSVKSVDRQDKYAKTPLRLASVIEDRT